MSYKSDERIFLNYGWDHIWCRPRKSTVREFIKGPFREPKIVQPFPWVSYCQPGPVAGRLRLNEGIPDPWIEYLICNRSLARQSSRKYESMHKEDVDIVRSLRRKYRLYLGQGIPDPWVSYPFINRSELYFEDLKPHIKRYICQLLHGKRYKKYSREAPCHCCEKAYLFDCPDKHEADGYNVKDDFNCSCQDCHGKSKEEVTDSKQCTCIQLLQDWVFRNSNWIKEKEDGRANKKEPYCPDFISMSSSKYGTDDETTVENLKSPSKSKKCCLCARNYETNTDTTCECANKTVSIEEKESKLKGLTSDEKSNNNSHKCQPDKQTKFCFCPYLKNLGMTKRVLRRRISEKKDETDNWKSPYERVEMYKFNRVAISKEVQTDTETLKQSKTIQTENVEIKQPTYSKTQSKPKCNNKCFRCSICSCDNRYFSQQQLRNICCSQGMVQNPQFICPYSQAGHLLTHELQKPKCPGYKSKRMKEKRREKEVEEDESSAQSSKDELRPHVKNQGERRASLLKKCEPVNTKNYSENKKIYCSRSSNAFLNFSKYLSDKEVKDYLRRREFPFETIGDKFYHYKPTSIIPKPRSFYEMDLHLSGNSSNKIELEKCKPFYQKSGSGKMHSALELPKDEKKIFSPRKGTFFASRLKWFNCGGKRSSTLTNELEKPKKELSTRLKFFKEMVESDESRTFGLIRQCKGSCRRHMRRRRLSNYKKRKWAASRKSESLKYPIYGNESPRSSKCEDKIIQVEETEDFTVEPSENETRRFFFNFDENTYRISNAGEILNFTPRRNQCRTVGIQENLTPQSTERNLQAGGKRPTNVFDKFRTNRNCLTGKQRSFHSDLEKASYNSETTWSTNTLKSVVDDLLIEENTRKKLNKSCQQSQFYKNN